MYFFARLDEEHKLLGNFEKFLKMFAKNSIENLIFNDFWKVVAKNRAFANNMIFYNNFFHFEGGGRSLCPPLAAPMTKVSGF